jgi:hypothetical protein
VGSPWGCPQVEQFVDNFHDYCCIRKLSLCDVFVVFLQCDFEHCVNLLQKGERRGPKTWPEGTNHDTQLTTSIFGGTRLMIM